MMRSTLLILLIFGAAAASTPCRGQTLPSKSEAAQLIKKTRETMNLRTPGTEPFHLVAKFYNEIAGQSFDGTYELLWLSAGEYREEFRMGGTGETDVVLHDKRYVLRTTPTLTLQLWNVRNLLAAPFVEVKNFAPELEGVHAENDSKKFRVNVRQGSDQEPLKVTYWYDIATRAIFLIQGNQTPSRFGSIPPPDLSWELSEFVAFGTKTVPLRWLRRAFGQTVEVHIEKLEAVSAFASSVFEAPQNAVIYQVCTEGDARMSGPWPEMPKVSLMHPKAFPAYYLLGRHDGRVEKSVPVISSGGTVDRDMENWFQAARIPILLCGDTPIDYETIVIPGAAATLGMVH
jgi:hypothetical protein